MALDHHLPVGLFSFFVLDKLEQVRMCIDSTVPAHVHLLLLMALNKSAHKRPLDL
jgi:hypothetical protein